MNVRWKAIKKKLGQTFFINWFTTKPTWILQKYNKNKIEILFWLLLKMKEKFTKIESRLTFVDENYTNGWSLQRFFL